MTQPYDPANDAQYQVPQYAPQYQTGAQQSYDPYGQGYGQSAYPPQGSGGGSSFTKTSNIWISLTKVIAWIIFGAFVVGGALLGLGLFAAGDEGVILGVLAMIGGVILGFTAVSWQMIVLNWARDTAAIRAKLYSS